MVSNSISDEQELSRSQMKNRSNMQTFLGNKFKVRPSPKNSLGQSFFGGSSKEPDVKTSQAEPGYVDHSNKG